MEGKIKNSSLNDPENEVEIEKEKAKLKAVIETINEEILGYIEKRKQIANYILDYRKKNLEEFEDDEDKIIEYFDHERYVKEEAYRTIDRRLKELTVLELSPYFGRVDFNEEEFGEDSIYIGRFGVTLEEANDPLIVDWRAPIASLFYGSGLGKANYKAPTGEVEIDILKKRQYIIKKGKLVGMFDSDVDVKDEILQLVLSQSAGEKLKDVVMTIQEEQDNIIRQDRNKAVIVNGVAGSGKTTIALHRVAYLLYNYRNILQDKVLILGPNSIFMEYISTVLPSLGEVGVNQKTFKEFAIEMLDISLRKVMTTKDYMEKILGNDSEFIEEVIHKTSDAFIYELDELINKVEREYYKIQDVAYNGSIVVSTEEIKNLFNKHYKNMPIFRRTKKVKRILFSKLKDERDNRIREIEAEYKKTIASCSDEELRLNGTSIDYKRKLKIREAIKELMEVKKSLVWLDNPTIEEVYKELNGDKLYTIDDLTALLYLGIKLDELTVGKEIKHVVIDEAQDYSTLAFIVVKELTNCSGMTIVGDSNQRILPLKEEVPMTKLETVIWDIEVEHFKLNKSYRSTKEIMDYANEFLKDESIVPLVRNGEPVKEITVNSENEFIEKTINLIKALNEKGYESIAVICRDLKETEYLGALLKSKDYIKIIDKENSIYTGGDVVIPSYLAKGLEFDAVIIVDSADKNKEDKIKYVMATRALHELVNVKFSI